MRINLFLSFIALGIFTVGYSQSNIDQEITNSGNAKGKEKKITSNKEKPDKKIKALRKKHAKFLANSPFKKTLKLSKEERKAAGLPPNKFYEEQFELTFNPATGRTEQQNVFEVQKRLTDERAASRVPGDQASNAWVERGPTNVGGRTRVILFDPNDATNRRVFAGAASGGLWVKTDITSNAAWTRVVGVPGNLNISCITVDPNNLNTWYLGTGEQYTGGDAVGNGVYKTTDGGTTWVNVPVNYVGNTFNLDASNLFVAGIFYINDIIARNNAGNTEVFIGVGCHIYSSASSPSNWSGMEQAGLYKTTDGGTTWTRNQEANMLAIANGGRNYYQIPNDFEKDALGNLWFSTTSLPAFGLPGGKIYKSTDGITWTLEETIPTTDRTEIEPSTTDANKFYVLAEDTNGQAKLFLTTDAFATAPLAINEPDDADNGIPAADFTRGQAFYDLVIECDPTNDAIVYAGGIDLFRSTNSGTSWTQISKWSNNANLNTLNCSLVHADQHVMTFRPGLSNEAVFGNDGGVYYTASLSTADAAAVIPSRNSGYNVTQFYSVGVRPVNGVLLGDYAIAGAQDNGTQLLANVAPGAAAGSIQAQGGDGAYSLYDQDGANNYMITNYVHNENIISRDGTDGTQIKIIDNDAGANSGAFICPMTLDSNLNILYSDYTVGAAVAIRRYTNVGSLAPTARTNLTNALLTGAPTALKVSRHTVASTTLLVGCKNGRVLLVTNANAGAAVWTNITGPGFVGSVSDVEFGATENDIFVTFHNYGVTSIWYSADRGVTWQNKEGNFPNIPVKCILQNPLNLVEVIIGTDLGVWYTNTFNTGAPIWLQSYNGMSDVKVTDLQLRNDNAVYAATYGRGIFSGIFTAPLLSTNENSIVKNSIKVYPTISKGNITISTDKTYGKTNLQLFDVTGKNVFSKTLNLDTASQEVNFGSLSSGNYILKMSGESFETTNHLIIE